MTWREFQLRRVAYERQEKTSWLKVREISYMIYCSIPEKSPKKSREQFMPIEKKFKKQVASEDATQRYLEEIKKYYKNK